MSAMGVQYVNMTSRKWLRLCRSLVIIAVTYGIHVMNQKSQWFYATKVEKTKKRFRQKIPCDLNTEKDHTENNCRLANATENKNHYHHIFRQMYTIQRNGSTEKTDPSWQTDTCYHAKCTKIVAGLDEDTRIRRVWGENSIVQKIFKEKSIQRHIFARHLKPEHTLIAWY